MIRELSLLSLLATACNGASGSGSSDSGAHTVTLVLSCPSPLGAIRSQVTYGFAASEEPARAGSAITYTLTPPASVGQAPVPTTFIASSSTYATPAGLALDSATVQAVPNDYSSVTAQLDAGVLIVSTTGSFAVDGSLHPVPPIDIAAHVTAQPGATITWNPPISVVGQANAVFVGTQTADCQLENPQALWVTHVAAN